MYRGRRTPARGGGAGGHALAALLAALAVVLLTWPYAARLTTALPNAARDGQENVWNIWWAKQALLVQPANPFWASTLYHPDGTSLLFHALGLAVAPLAIPLQFLLDATTALNATLLVLLWLLALTTYWLVLDIVHHRPAALLAGLFVALAPAHLYHLLLGQINLTALAPVPFILLAQRRAMRRRHWGWVLAGGLGLVVCALADWQYTVMAGLMGGAWLLATLWRWRRRPVAGLRLALWGVAPFLLGGLLLSPLVLAMIAELRANRDYAVRPEWQTVLRSADLLALWTPNPYHPLWGGLGQALYDHYHPRIPYGGGVASLGLAALAGGLLAAWRWRPAARYWLLMLVVGALLSLGPTLHVLGATVEVPLPYRWLRAIPYMDVSRVPAVFLKWALLALAVLLALGLRTLLARAGRGRRGQVAAAVLGGLVLVEGLAAPLALPERPAVSTCYRQLAADPRPGAVLDLPAIGVNEPMYYQVLHGRPIVGGDLSRDNRYPFLSRTPLVSQIVEDRGRLRRDIFFPSETSADLQQVLAGWGIHWVILRPGDAGPDRARLEAQLTRLFGDAPPLCRDDLAHLWWIEGAPIVLDLGDGWHNLEQSRATGAYRWLGQQATAIIAAPTAGPARLSLTAWAHQRPRTLQVVIDGTPRGQLVVPPGPPSVVELIVHLPAGRGQLLLQAVEPATPGGGVDTRLLTVAVADLRLTAA